MKTFTSYENKKAGSIFFAFLFTLVACVFSTNYTFAQTYNSPIVITTGGTYTGNWESKNSEIAAVEVRTSEPVIIENSNIRGAGILIKSLGHHANITVRNTNGYGLTPTPWSNYKKPRRFLALDVFKNVVIENCYMENTAGIVVAGTYTGNQTTANTIKIRYNKVKNIDGRVYGGRDLVQFVQFNFKTAIKNAEVAWNQVINDPNNSQVEDNINIFNTQGASDSPIRIHNNFIKGAYLIPASSTGYTGGGIISDTNADLAQATRHIDAYENHLVNLGNYSMGIAGGNNIRYHHNRAVNSATFADGSRFAMYTSGLWSNDYYKKGTTFSNSIDHNEVGITAWGYPNDRHDFNPNEWASYINNINLPGPITLQTEADEYTRWQQKLSRNGIVLGPNGSSGSTSSPAATLSPEPTPTAPSTSTGKITRDFWNNIVGTSTANVPVATTPSSTSELTTFQAPSNVGNGYGQRIRGYVTAPVSGQYTFFISSDDHSDLFLSTSEDPARKVKIASVSGWVAPGDWTKQASQQSVKVTLEAGKRYYIEAVMLEIWGDDHLAVGWQLPNGTLERPIAGNRISPMGSVAPAAVNQAPSITLTAPAANATFETGKAITLTANASDADGKVARVEFFQGTTKMGESTASPYSYSWTNATAGSYSITAKATDDKGASKTSTAVNITVKDAAVAAATTTTTGTGKITRDFWNNIVGTSTANVPVATTPSSTSELTTFQAPSNVGNGYGQRIRGYVTAPVSGQYTFFISSDDHSDLFLSTSEDPARKVKIASVSGWVAPGDWTKQASQQSVKVTLEAGKRYYIEAVMLEIWGDDHLAVGWQLPNGMLERPIAGNRISPMGSIAPAATAPVVTPIAATGKIMLDFWSGVYGTSVSDVPVSKTPTKTVELTSFEAPSNQGSNYGQRIRGYVTAPTSGQYTFWIAADDIADLYLSTSEDPAKKVKIAYSAKWTNSREWTKSSTQQSVKITLEAGKRYYIEAIMLQGAGGDNLAVGWQLPNGTLERPIAGNRLSPLDATTTLTANSVSSLSTISFTAATAYPNPFRNVITLDLGSNNKEKLTGVVLIDQAGRVVYTVKNLELSNNKLEIDLSGTRIASGMYILKYSLSTGSTHTFKIIKE